MTKEARAQRRIAAVALAVAAATFAAAAAPATAAVTVTSYKISSDLPAFPTVPTNGPSTLQAGANPNAGSYTSFSYPNASEDLKTALTNFAPGLLGNPEAVPKCSEALLQAGGSGCPSGSAIGTSRLDAQISANGALLTGLAGTVYNAEPLGTEPGRLGVVTPVTGGFLVSSIPFTITPRGETDYGLTGTLTDINRLPAAVFGVDLQVRALSFVLNGDSNKFVRNPTSCGSNTSTGQAIGYDDPTVVEGPAYTFTTTGCSSVAFGPSLSVQIGDKGTTKQNGYPPVIVKITQPAGQADMLGNKITLPTALNSNNSAYKLCSQEQAAADNCPANSKFGWATAKSPFLSESLGGPVYLVSQSGQSLPGLLLDLRGRAHVKIQTKTTLINNRQIQSLVLNAPQLPVSELEVALNGGRTTGVFQNRSNLCFKGNSTSKFKTANSVVKFYGWNGVNTNDTKVAAKVKGCGPGVSGNLSKPISSEPRLRVKVTKHPDAANIKELTVKLGSNLSVVRSKLAGLEFVDAHTVKLTDLAAAGVDKATVTLDSGAVRVSERSRSILKHGRSRSFKVKVTQTPVSGPAVSTRSSFKEKL
jgi:hypothetical protein